MCDKRAQFHLNNKNLVAHSPGIIINSNNYKCWLHFKLTDVIESYGRQRAHIDESARINKFRAYQCTLDGKCNAKKKISKLE